MTSAKGPTLAVVPPANGEGAQVLQPSGWPMPKGYANGMAAEGRIIVTGGVIGWDTDERLAEGFIAQVRQTLANIKAILEAGGRRILILHGDVFDKFLDKHPILSELGYLIYKFLQHIDRSHTLARNAKHGSKTFLRSARLIAEGAVEKARQCRCTAVVCGHTHTACVNNQQEIAYAVVITSISALNVPWRSAAFPLSARPTLDIIASLCFFWLPDRGSNHAFKYKSAECPLRAGADRRLT